MRGLVYRAGAATALSADSIRWSVSTICCALLSYSNRTETSTLFALVVALVPCVLLTIVAVLITASVLVLVAILVGLSALAVEAGLNPLEDLRAVGGHLTRVSLKPLDRGVVRGDPVHAVGVVMRLIQFKRFDRLADRLVEQGDLRDLGPVQPAVIGVLIAARPTTLILIAVGLGLIAVPVPFTIVLDVGLARA